MIQGIIAECGNHHFGDLSKAKEMIRLAKECGADYVKFQAIDPDTFTGGSMPRAFYSQCDLGMKGYLALLVEGQERKIPVFFSIFGPKYAALAEIPIPYKISGSQFLSMSVDELTKWNERITHEVVISVPEVDSAQLEAKKNAIRRMNVMYVGGYLEVPNLGNLQRYAKVLGKSVGYSDHTISIASAAAAIDHYAAPLVEKHFNLWGVQEFQGVVYRDSLHAATPGELSNLAKVMKGS